MAPEEGFPTLGFPDFWDIQSWERVNPVSHERTFRAGAIQADISPLKNQPCFSKSTFKIDIHL